MNRLKYYFISIWSTTRQLFGHSVNNYWVISEECYDKYLSYERKVVELEKENRAYVSLCNKLIRIVQEQKDLIDILSEDRED